MAVDVHFCPLLLLCCRMGSRGDGSDAVDVMPSSAPSLARDGLGYHGHGNDIDSGGRQSQAILSIRRNYVGMYHARYKQKAP
jgi:hypothetical protein